MTSNSVVESDVTRRLWAISGTFCVTIWLVIEEFNSYGILTCRVCETHYVETHLSLSTTPAFVTTVDWFFKRFSQSNGQKLHVHVSTPGFSDFFFLISEK